MRFVILHYHILKNAGTTIEEILYNSFRERFARFDTEERDASISNADLLSFLERNPDLKAVTSHQIRYPVPTAPGFIFFDICLLRGPIDRILSMYYYFREKPSPGDPVSDFANQFELGPFVGRLIEEMPWYISDIQVNLLVNGIVNDRPAPEDLKLAIERMRNISFLGVVDRFEESLIAGQRLLRHIFPNLNCTHPPANVSGGLDSTLESRRQKLREACGSSVYAELMRMNAMDYELLECARAEIDRRLKLVPDRREPLPSPEQPAGVRASRPSLPTRMKRLVQVLPYLDVLWFRKENLFDANYYRAANPDVASAGINPLLHFIFCGAFEGRKPHPLFDTIYYLQRYPDVAASGANPLGHYLKHGAAEGRQPHPLFDPAYYLERNPDVRKAGINPLIHYILHGAPEGRKPHRLFQPDYYLSRCPEAWQRGGNLLVDFLESDPANCPSPHLLFDCESYVRENPAVAAQGWNPLVHYMLFDARKKGPSAKYENLPVAYLDIDDVRIAVVFMDADSAARAGLAGDIVPVWRDSCGRTSFIAPPQQRPFFQCLNYDQLFAQVNRTITY